jgi:hypothetical protein
MKAHKFTILLLVYFAASGAALTQGVKKADYSLEYYQGIASNTPRCPAIRYLIGGVSSNPVGYVWFADASGMSKATGTMDLVSGQFHLTLTSLDGQGPIGEVIGRKDLDTGVVTAELDGPGCSKLKLGPTNPYVRRADGTD